jgi:hypothetical protein
MWCIGLRRLLLGQHLAEDLVLVADDEGRGELLSGRARERLEERPAALRAQPGRRRLGQLGGHVGEEELPRGHRHR